VNKGAPSKKPKVAGINEIDVPSSETDVPATYFAGAQRLNVTWIMQPVIAFTKPTPSDTGKGK
jgi:hypothetical protein